MPNPGKKEKQDTFISRFMGSEEAKKDFPDEKQRLAVAYSKWKAERKKMAANEAARVFTQNHPGHSNQKVHGHQGGVRAKADKDIAWESPKNRMSYAVKSEDGKGFDLYVDGSFVSSHPTLKEVKKKWGSMGPKAQSKPKVWSRD